LSPPGYTDRARKAQRAVRLASDSDKSKAPANADSPRSERAVLAFLLSLAGNPASPRKWNNSKVSLVISGCSRPLVLDNNHRAARSCGIHTL
jgi:hypothetical protein